MKKDLVIYPDRSMFIVNLDKLLRKILQDTFNKLTCRVVPPYCLRKVPHVKIFTQIKIAII